MVNGSKRKLRFFIIAAFALLFFKCANQLPPGGGDIDRIPPQIMEVYPKDGTVNFNDDYFELGFSEYVEKRSVKEAIFISPSIDGDLELDWSGKYVRVYFPGELMKNATYVVTIGTDVADYNNKNKMAEAFTFTFSTGNEIDTKIIAGKVYDKKPQGVMLFAYRISDGDPNPMLKKPDYISQTGSDGKYKLAGLAEGKYRIFAVRDEFRDLVYQPEQDEIGIPFQDVLLGAEDTLFTGLDFLLTAVDTVKPRLLNAVMTDQRHILLSFSEELDRDKIKPLNFYLFDSTRNRRIDIKYAFKGKNKITELVLVPNEIIQEQSTIYLFADSIFDQSGNGYFSDFVEVSLSDRADTLKTDIYKVTPANGSSDVDFLQANFIFEFNDGFDALLARQGITFSDTMKRTIPFEIKILDDASFIISSVKRLEMSKDYIIKIDLSKFKDAAGNYYDSIYQYKFKTISGLEFTGASGRIVGIDKFKNPKIELKSIDKSDLIYSTSLTHDGQFNFERVIPGKYSLFAYYDIDSSSTYTFGHVTPFKNSEEFFFYPDTLNLRARWTETDLKFELNKR